MKQGAEINHQDHAGQTALHVAVRSGHSDIAKYLVSNGANVNLAKTNGSTPLILAGTNEQFDIAKYLIKQEADKSATNKKGQDFSHFAGRLAAKGDEKWIALLPNGKNNKALLQFKSKLAETKTQKSTQIASSTQTSNAQCSKDEVLKMVNAGFGKEEINRFCQNQSPQTSFSSSSINQLASEACLKQPVDNAVYDITLTHGDGSKNVLYCMNRKIFKDKTEAHCLAYEKKNGKITGAVMVKTGFNQAVMCQPTITIRF